MPRRSASSASGPASERGQKCSLMASRGQKGSVRVSQAVNEERVEIFGGGAGREEEDRTLTHVDAGREARMLVDALHWSVTYGGRGRQGREGQPTRRRTEIREPKATDLRRRAGRTGSWAW